MYEVNCGSKLQTYKVFSLKTDEKKESLLPFDREEQNMTKQKCDDTRGMIMKMRDFFFSSEKLSNKLQTETNHDT